MDERKSDLTAASGMHVAKSPQGAEIVTVDGSSVVLLPGGGTVPVGNVLPSGQVYTASAPQPTIIVINHEEKKDDKKDEKKKKKRVSEVFKSL